MAENVVLVPATHRRKDYLHCITCKKRIFCGVDHESEYDRELQPCTEYVCQECTELLHRACEECGRPCAITLRWGDDDPDTVKMPHEQRCSDCGKCIHNSMDPKFPQLGHRDGVPFEAFESEDAGHHHFTCATCYTCKKKLFPEGEQPDYGPPEMRFKTAPNPEHDIKMCTPEKVLVCLNCPSPPLPPPEPEGTCDVM